MHTSAFLALSFLSNFISTPLAQLTPNQMLQTDILQDIDTEIQNTESPSQYGIYLNSTVPIGTSFPPWPPANDPASCPQVWAYLCEFMDQEQLPTIKRDTWVWNGQSTGACQAGMYLPSDLSAMILPSSTGCQEYYFEPMWQSLQAFVTKTEATSNVLAEAENGFPVVPVNESYPRFFLGRLCTDDQRTVGCSLLFCLYDCVVTLAFADGFGRLVWRLVKSSLLHLEPRGRIAFTRMWNESVYPYRSQMERSTGRDSKHQQGMEIRQMSVVIALQVLCL